MPLSIVVEIFLISKLITIIHENPILQFWSRGLDILLTGYFSINDIINFNSKGYPDES